MIAHEIEAFGRHLGIEGLEWTSDEPLRLEIEPSDTLEIRALGERLVVALSRRQTYPESPSAARLLELVHYEHTSGVPVHCRRADFGRTNIFYVLLPLEIVQAGEIASALDAMTKLHNLADSV